MPPLKSPHERLNEPWPPVIKKMVAPTQGKTKPMAVNTLRLNRCI